MNKSTLLRKVNDKLDKITTAVDELKDILDTLEDGELSEMANDFANAIVDFMTDNDTVTSGDIINYIEEYFAEEK